MMGRIAGGRAAALVLALSLLSACGQIVPPAKQQKPVVAANAVSIGVRRGPPLPGLTIPLSGARRALNAFAASCARASLRPDTSGLTQPQDWAAPCQAAGTWPRDDAARFFATWFETAIVGTGTTYVTGYFEPEIAGSRSHLPGFDVPIYRLPPDLVRARPGDAPPGPDGRQPLGRYDANGIFVPYWDRAQIEDGALAGKGLEIGWAADPAELFFLQVQGSGRLRAPDGTVMRIGYAGENGWAYTGIGSVMNGLGLIGSGPGQYAGSMQGILRYIRENPAQGRALMRQNRSFIFFRDTTAIAGDPTTGPVGALSVPVTPRVTLAVDPAFVPLGAPVFLTTDRPDVGGLWVAQDTGGAIKGANRFDSFWGAGAEARHIAGGMSAHGQALILVPRGVLARLRAR
ncbi:murein transglycosylase A [Novosphingobium sp. Fuku2-ISO-50]|uniref:murein transglycosylase A n=1 Tax=Novosphingobium sp. Fuku2-ISO-50 TaxID=1739114 RepID=UPI00076D6EF6|nr:MltA domain-containing protein [Novosphingobium sp. Fuku2-ISO-50]KUR78821.1 MltA [Novosphingobium sp. Fuku2-ISO-50]